MPAEMIHAQIAALRPALAPRAVKIGMTANAAIVRAIATHLKPFDAFVVLDPVFRASSQEMLTDEEALRVAQLELFPKVDLMTPNLPEAEHLLRRAIRTDEEVESAAADLLGLGPGSVLLKGGHRGAECVQDYFTCGSDSFWLSGPRVDAAGTHGTGCVLSSAIAAGMARGLDLPDSLVLARAYIQQALRESWKPEQGTGPVVPGSPPHSPCDMPWITSTAEAGRRRLAFPSAEESPFGLYPVVDTIEWVERLLPLGLKAIQLRIKDPSRPDIEESVREAVAAARRSPTKLYINDHYEAAIRHGAYGVHLGQDDMNPKALQAVAEAGLRLGLSTHSYFEMARSRAVQPSYIAIGTVFRSTSKVMDYKPLGLEAFRAMCSLAGCPVIAIGGIHLPHAEALRHAGADGMAVISEIKAGADPKTTIRAWKQALAHG